MNSLNFRALLALLALASVGCGGASVVGSASDGGGLDAAGLDGGGLDGGLHVTCAAGQLFCGGRCVDPGVDPAHCGACGAACAPGQGCVAGACEMGCPSAQASCAGECRNLQTDGANCGACGMACAVGQVCSLGRCATTCDASLATCAGDGGAAAYCADARTDRRNCGACGVACAAGQACVDGGCALACAGSQRDCSGACRDLATDDANCGACGHACPPGNTCAAGTCEVSCGAGLSQCGPGCVNLQTDNAHCGRCGAPCPAGRVCSGGVCGTTCAAPAATCGAGEARRCAATAIDPAHCGSCDRACALDHTQVQGCTGGACAVVRCAAGYGDCDGAAANGCETATSASTAHCGACGRACLLAHATPACAAGACAVMACDPGFADCDHVASNGCEVDTRTTTANCGACGTSCAAGQVCSGGVCGATCAAPLATCGTAPTAFCANTAIDPTNCGACGMVCALAHVAAHGCAGGMCTPARCAAGFGDCDGLASNGCETDVTTSAASCGSCGRFCALPNATATCAVGACAVLACATGFADCDANPANGCEVDTRTDNASCGACGTACAAGQVCSGGVCGATCAAPLATCGAAPMAFCANPANDPTNCGACATECALAGAAANGCAAGACTVVRCNAGAGDCNATAADGCETNLQTSEANCGACGRACALPHASATCAGGSCGVAACAAGFADCDHHAANGCEVDTRTDNTSCGACGTTCAAGQVCSGGVCGATCAAPLRTCGAGATAFCADAAIDPANCGACGTVCALAHVAAQGCGAGACTVARCTGGFGDCDGAAANGCETDLNADATSCGACGRACALPNATASCAAGQCAVAACATGFADCDRDPTNGCEVDTRTDNASCGACGTTCAAGQVCSGGACGATCAAPLRTCGAGATAFCANAAIDPTNCGGCGTACALAHVAAGGCAGGDCTVVRCGGGFGDCDGAAANGCETDLNASAASCGACGRACVLANAAASCAAGACAITACGRGFADCNANPADGCEVDTRSDSTSCGACGGACGAGEVCSAGVCATTCAPPFSTCGAAPAAFCANTGNNPAHCGACGAACALDHAISQGCAAGACTVVGCASGFGDCDGAAVNGCETNTQTTLASCGACGRTCALLNATSACTAGVCALVSCAPGFADCNANPADGCEVDTRTDNASCGACGTACAAGRMCSGGLCGTTCAAPLRTCGTAPATFCASVASDPENCGACDVGCALAHVAANGCAAGACTVVRCTGGFGDCDGTAANGCETDLAASATNCGACGRVCALSHASSTCAAGACAVTACATGFLDCDGAAANGCEVDTRRDNANCGGCGTTCAAGRVCSAGVCGTTCAPPLSACGTAPATYCANPAIDPANCNACGAVCALDHVATNGCAAGACTVVRCAGSYGDCDGTAANGCETDLAASVANCGACGRACALPNATATCTAGACAVAACATGFLDCDANAANGCEVDTRSDNANCGTCGTTCPTGRVCSGAVCGATCAAPLRTCGAGPSAYCTNTAIDPTDCGACGVACALAHVAANGCDASACTVVRCAAGYGDCDGTAANGCETSTQTSAAHCGACGRACALPNATSVCAAGACAVTVCGSGFRDCDGAAANGCEVDTRSDNANCGGCGTTCAAGQVCSGGVCGAACASPLRTCGAGPSAYCANPAIDPANCNACGAVCALANVAAQGCAAGACSIVGCAAGFADCDGTAANGCETGTRTSAANCGACGRVCALPNAAATCTAGACAVATCATGFLDCDLNAANGCEVDTRSDNANCGGCGAACAAGRVCSAGVCGATCAAPLTACGAGPSAFCANTSVDPANCGACNGACALAHAAANGCAAGACTVVRCAAGFGDCDGTASNGCETGTLTSPTHCGTCGRTCALPNATATCAAGACAIAACAAGFGDCDGLAANGCEANTRTDNAHCGSCPNACGGSSVCAAGACAVTCQAGQTNCSGSCVALGSDPLHCGNCLTLCPVRANAAAYCAGGTCGSACLAGFGDCDGNAANGCETDLRSSTAHCGACGNRCALSNANATCVAGVCGLGSCTVLYANCDGNAANGCEVSTYGNNANCGGCGRACVSPQFCSATACSCAAGSHAIGTACVPDSAVPRPISPLSLGDVTRRRPSFYWVLPAPYNGADVEIFADRACTVRFAGNSPVTVTGGNTGRPDSDLPAGVTAFWRVRGRIGNASDTVTSAVWEFHVPRLSAPGIDTSFNPHVDVNGDGYDDVVVGSPSADPAEGENAGTVSVFHGGPGGLTAVAARVLTGSQADGNLGVSVAGAGDVNGDGYGDLIVAERSTRNEFGSFRPTFRVYHGSAAGIGPYPAVIVRDDGALFAADTSVACAGDVNGDGYADVVVGMSDVSRARVFHGGAAGVSTVAAITLLRANPDDLFGRSVASAGDVNGDGYSDLVVAAPQAISPSEPARVGCASVYHGGVGGITATPARVIFGDATNNFFGSSVASAGDVNGDGFADLVVGDPFATPLGSPEYVGTASVFRGSVGGIAAVAARVLVGSGTRDSFGQSVARAGDVDGDGYGDILVGAPGAGAGSASVFRGGASGVEASAVTVLRGGGAWGGHSFGAVVAGGDDVNGDGLADLLVQAPQYTVGGMITGAVGVFPGNQFGISATPAIILAGTRGGDAFGTSVASAVEVSGYGERPWCALVEPRRRRARPRLGG